MLEQLKDYVTAQVRNWHASYMGRISSKKLGLLILDHEKKANFQWASP